MDNSKMLVAMEQLVGYVRNIEKENAELKVRAHKMKCGKTSVPIGDVKISKAFQNTNTNTSKILTCSTFYTKNGVFDRPIIVDENNMLLDGYAAYLAAKILGHKTVLIYRVSHR